MLFDVTLRISYQFGDHPATGRQILRVLPKSLPGRQRVVAASLSFRPRPHERRDGVDFFGNATVEASYQNATGDVGFTVNARVNRLAQAPVLDLSPRLPALAAALGRQNDLGPLSPHHFTGASARIRPDKAIAEYVRGLVAPGMTVIEAGLALNGALFRDMRFDAEATDVDTPAAAAFAVRRGVCQDFTHIMITALRAVGIPAGYVSGLLRTLPPEGQPRLEGADATHAWVMAWCGEEAGWVEFDPTNGMMVGADHITIAVGRDYSDVAPVSGILKTAGGHDTEQAVDVIALSS